MKSNDLRDELLKNILYDIKSDVKVLNSKAPKNKSRVLRHLENLVEYMENVITAYNDDADFRYNGRTYLQGKNDYKNDTIDLDDFLKDLENDNYGTGSFVQPDESDSKYTFRKEDKDILDFTFAQENGEYNWENRSKPDDGIDFFQQNRNESGDIREQTENKFNENINENNIENIPGENQSENIPEKTGEKQGDISLTLKELARYNGLNGMPAYVAVEGIIYDVTNSPLWTEGSHFGLMAGKSLTIDYQACHAGRPTLDRVPVVGKVKTENTPKS